MIDANPLNKSKFVIVQCCLEVSCETGVVKNPYLTGKEPDHWINGSNASALSKTTANYLNIEI